MKKTNKRHDGVGYGSPPTHTRFKKGQSGNPSGRPRGKSQARAEKLILKEAYRPVRIKEGENIVTLPALQAILRGLVARAAKGDGPGQRTLIAIVQAVENTSVAKEKARTLTETKVPELSDFEAARRMVHILMSAERKLQKRQSDGEED